MKNLKKVLFLFIAISAFSVAKSQAQVVVRVRPERPREVVVARPVAPSPRHVWVAEEWTPTGGRYVYHGGYWAVPPRPHAVWAAGHWRHRHGGYIWIGGRWN
jgi:hypothetical protein